MGWGKAPPAEQTSCCWQFDLLMRGAVAVSAAVQRVSLSASSRGQPVTQMQSAAAGPAAAVQRSAPLLPSWLPWISAGRTQLCAGQRHWHHLKPELRPCAYTHHSFRHSFRVARRGHPNDLVEYDFKPYRPSVLFSLCCSEVCFVPMYNSFPQNGKEEQQHLQQAGQHLRCPVTC